MRIARLFHRIHPLVAIAAVTVSLFSLMGIAAITGLLPSSHATSTGPFSAMTQPVPVVADDWDANKPLQKNLQPKHVAHTQSTSAKVGALQQNPATSAPVQTAHKPVPHNSPVGIGVGALIGGVLGNKVGGGDGKTLATIAGAVGGGYIGNEVAKKNQQP
jgi:uncharacterized protein YcfJ